MKKLNNELTGIVGMTEEEARKELTSRGFVSIRVRIRDGQSFIGTCDYRLDRTNLIIENGIVKGCSVG